MHPNNNFWLKVFCGKMFQIRYSRCSLESAALSHLKLNEVLRRVHEAIIAHADELGLAIPTTMPDVDLSRAIQCHFVRYADDVGALPVSYCERAEAGPQIFIHFTAQEANECPPLIVSLFEHVLTHAIRFLYALQQNELVAKGNYSNKRILPTSESTPQRHELQVTTGLLFQQLYKLEGEAFHSGYLIEHVLNEGLLCWSC